MGRIEYLSCMRKLCRPSMTPYEFEQLVQERVLPRIYPNGTIRPKCACDLNGKTAIPDFVVDKNRILSGSSVIDAKFKVELSETDVLKLDRDAKCIQQNDQGFLGFGVFKRPADKLMITNSDIRIPPRVQQLLDQKRVTVLRTKIPKYCDD